VKNMVEEGCELFGYTLCLFATVGYLRKGEWGAPPHQNRASSMPNTCTESCDVLAIAITHYLSRYESLVFIVHIDLCASVWMHPS
jgi:hypothetical protein